MNLKTFFIGISTAFGIPFLMIVVYPFLSMKNRDAVKYLDEDGNEQIYFPASATFQRGADIYQSENCQACHTQVIRNSFSGSEIFREDWAGVVTYDDRGQIETDTRRESISWDYRQNFASLGERRTGPDLINYGARIQQLVTKANAANADAIEKGEIQAFTAEELTHLHLYDPRNDTAKKLGLNSRSNCPSLAFMFEKVTDAGQGAVNALPVKTKAGYQVVPSSKIKSLTRYLLGLSRHDQLPEGLDKSGAK